MLKRAEKENKKYCCWISEKDRILSFSAESGYEFKEFNTQAEFQEYYYNKTYWGYRVK